MYIDSCCYLLLVGAKRGGQLVVVSAQFGQQCGRRGRGSRGGRARRTRAQIAASTSQCARRRRSRRRRGRLLRRRRLGHCVVRSRSSRGVAGGSGCSGLRAALGGGVRCFGLFARLLGHIAQLVVVQQAQHHHRRLLSLLDARFGSRCCCRCR